MIKWFSIFIALLVAVVLPFLSVACAADGYRVSKGNTVEINEHGICKQITNRGAAADIYVPTRHANEWSNGSSAFLNRVPSGVSVDECAPSCSGVEVGGYCWYYAEHHNQKCTDLCASHGGYNAATRDYIGLPGKQGNCFKVSAALKTGGSPIYLNGCSSHPSYNATGLGCHTYAFSPSASPYFIALCSNANPYPTATSGNSNDGRRRICACNN